MIPAQLTPPVVMCEGGSNSTEKKSVHRNRQNTGCCELAAAHQWQTCSFSCIASSAYSIARSSQYKDAAIWRLPFYQGFYQDNGRPTKPCRHSLPVAGFHCRPDANSFDNIPQSMRKARRTTLSPLLFPFPRKCLRPLEKNYQTRPRMPG